MLYFLYIRKSEIFSFKIKFNTFRRVGHLSNIEHLKINLYYACGQIIHKKSHSFSRTLSSKAYHESYTMQTHHILGFSNKVSLNFF